MALVFQYGSNTSTARLNHPDRLAGDAKPICIASTSKAFHLGFTVWSKTNKCAAADIVPTKSGRNIYGVVYDIPDFLIFRDSAKSFNRKSLDAIEGEGGNYSREKIELINSDGDHINAWTYVVGNKEEDLQTSFTYIQHILTGMREFKFPGEYYDYVVSRIIGNNPELEIKIKTHAVGRTYG